MILLSRKKNHFPPCCHCSCYFYPRKRVIALAEYVIPSRKVLVDFVFQRTLTANLEENTVHTLKNLN